MKQIFYKSRQMQCISTIEKQKACTLKLKKYLCSNNELTLIIYWR
jgi:hypothetical protein